MEKPKNCSFPIIREIQIENFPNSLTNGEYVFHTIGRLYGDMFKCRLRMSIEYDDGKEMLRYEIFIRKRKSSISKLDLTYKIYVVNHDDPSLHMSSVLKKIVKEDGIAFHTKLMEIDEILRPDSGWIKDGMFTIHVAIAAETLIGMNGSRVSNFTLPFYNRDHCAELGFMEDENIQTYFHKQMLKLHAPKLFDHEARNDIYSILLYIHGLQIDGDDNKTPELDVLFEGDYFKQVAALAHSNKIDTVVKKVERFLTQTYDLYYRKHWHWAYDIALECNMRSFLKELLKDVHCRKELRTIIQKNNIEKMSGEVMKQFTAKMLTFS